MISLNLVGYRPQRLRLNLRSSIDSCGSASTHSQLLNCRCPASILLATDDDTVFERSISACGQFSHGDESTPLQSAEASKQENLSCVVDSCSGGISISAILKN